MIQSEKIKQSKLIASAQNKGSKSFWREVNALCGDSKKSSETKQSVEVSYKNSEQKQTLRNAKSSKLFYRIQ